MLPNTCYITSLIKPKYSTIALKYPQWQATIDDKFNALLCANGI
jgi:hypothetical protein